MTQTVTIKEILLQCQGGMQCHTKLIKILKKVYATMGIERFWAEFQPLLKFPMVVYNREPAVERTIDFVARFVTSLGIKHPDNEQKDDDTEDNNKVESNPLLQRLFDFLLEHHSAKDRAVRFRVCQLVTKLLSSLGEEAMIDDALYERIFHCMLERLRDKTHPVRVQAVLALARLQDPSDANCPVIKAFLFLVALDPNPEVRKTVISCIAPCLKTLPAILKRTRDAKDTVRQVAFTVIAEKIPLKALTIGQRVQLLQEGLNDRAEGVRKVCGGKLLQKWLYSFEGNVLELLHSLDVENSTDICQQVLKQFFTDTPIADLVANFTLLDDQNLVPEQKLSPENAMYWWLLCQHVHQAGTDYEQFLDVVLPACLPFTRYLESVMNQLSTCVNLDKQLELEFILQHLLQLFSCMDLTDQACRKHTENILHKMLLSEHVSYSLVSHIIPCLHLLHTSTNSLVNYLAEVVAELRQPISVVEKAISAEEQRKVDIQVAKVRVQLNQLREELEVAVKQQDFQRAAELKTSISQSEAEKSSLMEAKEPVLEEIKSEKNDTPTLLKCLTIICEMLETFPLQTLSPTLCMLMESQVLPGMASKEPAVRNLAVKAIGLCCQLKCDIIMLHLPVLMQASQVDVECVRSTALKSLFDLIHIYGLGAFVDGHDTHKKGSVDDSADNSRDLMDSKVEDTEDFQKADDEQVKRDYSESGWSKTAGNLVAILSSLLDSETGELRNVVSEGLAKLLMSGRVFSSTLLSHLLLLWYNPMTEDDAQLRHTLGTFFPVFAFTNSSNQQLLEEAFLPTLRTILNAPTTSPLHDINTTNVADFLVELTHAQRLVFNQSSNSPVRDNPCHDSIAVKVCNEILSNPDSFRLKLWAHVLNQLSLSPDSQAHLKDLSTLCQQILETVKEKQCIKAIEKFHKTVLEMLESLHPQATSSTTLANMTALTTQATAEGRGDDTGAGGALVQPLSTTARRRCRAKTTATPNTHEPNPTLTAKSTGRKARGKKTEISELNRSVFTTPAHRQAMENNEEEFENLRCNLETMLLDGVKTPNNRARTPGNKRALHTAQDANAR
ncbi:condensin complex subunit 3-like isoform X2 [Pomacea canaliculata]|uniref:condensin complex subunit 3-like isoform X2 n=1 Tax=Pomacea canaliculata TaxID=400727 RepID=UPI000D737E27|nr:condensin complex subunit 3-like isoform X2 [Pomacea canaliculata]